MFNSLEALVLLTGLVRLLLWSRGRLWPGSGVCTGVQCGHCLTWSLWRTGQTRGQTVARGSPARGGHRHTHCEDQKYIKNIFITNIQPLTGDWDDRHVTLSRTLNTLIQSRAALCTARPQIESTKERVKGVEPLLQICPQGKSWL